MTCRALFTAAVVAAVAITPRAAAQTPSALGYTLHYWHDHDTTTVQVVQGRTVAELRDVGPDGPSPRSFVEAWHGDEPYRFDPKLGVQAALWFAVGDEPFGGKGYATADGTRYDHVEHRLTRESDRRSIGGHQAVHYHLVVVARGRQAGEDGAVVEHAGTAELWVADDLPFSWVPLTVGDGAGVPVAWQDPALYGYFARTLAAELAPHGLPLRIELQVVGSLDGSPYNELHRGVTIDDLAPTAGGPEADLSAAPTLTADEALSLQSAPFLLSECDPGKLEPAEGSRLDLRLDGQARTSRAVFGVADEAFTVMAGHFEGDQGWCLVLIRHGDAPEAGTYQLGSIAAAALTERSARFVGVYYEGTPASGRMALLDGGTIRIARLDGRTLEAGIAASGWAFDRSKGQRSDVSLTGSITARSP